MMQEPIWVQKATVADLHPRLIRRYGGVDGVRSADLLESALSRPLNLQHYNPSLSVWFQQHTVPLAGT